MDKDKYVKEKSKEIYDEMLNSLCNQMCLNPVEILHIYKFHMQWASREYAKMYSEIEELKLNQ